jgi:hypothetical protein
VYATGCAAYSLAGTRVGCCDIVWCFTVGHVDDCRRWRPSSLMTSDEVNGVPIWWPWEDPWMVCHKVSVSSLVVLQLSSRKVYIFMPRCFPKFGYGGSLLLPLAVRSMVEDSAYHRIIQGWFVFFLLQGSLCKIVWHSCLSHMVTMCVISIYNLCNEVHDYLKKGLGIQKNTKLGRTNMPCTF